MPHAVARSISRSIPRSAPTAVVAVVAVGCQRGYRAGIGSLSCARRWLDGSSDASPSTWAIAIRACMVRRFTSAPPAVAQLRSPERDTVLYPTIVSDVPMEATLAGCRAVAVPLGCRQSRPPPLPRAMPSGRWLWVNSPSNQPALDDSAALRHGPSPSRAGVLKRCYIPSSRDGRGRTIPTRRLDGVIAVRSLSSLEPRRCAPGSPASKPCTAYRGPQARGDDGPAAVQAAAVTGRRRARRAPACRYRSQLEQLAAGLAMVRPSSRCRRAASVGGRG